MARSIAGNFTKYVPVGPLSRCRTAINCAAVVALCFHPLRPHDNTGNDLGGEGGLSSAPDYLRLAKCCLRPQTPRHARLVAHYHWLITSTTSAAGRARRWDPANYCSACPVTRSGRPRSRRRRRRRGAGYGGRIPSGPHPRHVLLDRSQGRARCSIHVTGPLAARVIYHRLVKQLVYALSVD